MTTRRRASVLGATGSIGQSTLDLIGRAPDRFQVVALTGGRNIAQLAQDARRFGAEIAVTGYDDCLPALRDALAGTGIEAAAGPQALIEAAERPVDWLCSGIIGAAGLPPGLAALRRGTTVALANKETLVCAGALVMRTARDAGATLLPVDSEHSAIFQCLGTDSSSGIERVQITASGGAFRDWPLERLRDATPEEAATHPNWDMGQRITIDSASMFNKALELIETHEFFGIAADKIDAILHPESLVHAVVTHPDGGMIAHLGAPDMRHAIGYALNWPDRAALPVERLDLARAGQLTFREIDPARFPAIALARQVMEAGGHFGAIFNAAKEEALDAFIARQIRFTDMADVVAAVLDDLDHDSHARAAIDDLEGVLHADHMARKAARARTLAL